jgi:tetratricopeptide (TPR) repeat protein
MGDLALTYSALQMHNEALEMGENVLEFRRRVLHENHPDIGKNYTLSHYWFENFFNWSTGTAMDNLAATYCDLGRYNDALDKQHKALLLKQGVLPDHHPDIGEFRIVLDVFVWYHSFNCVFLQVTFAFTGISFHNISFSYEHVGSLPEALHCARKALRIMLANMPPGHGHIQLAESRVLHLESLMHQSAFPPDFSETCAACVTDEVTTAHARQAVSDHSRLPVTPMYVTQVSTPVTPLSSPPPSCTSCAPCSTK